MNNRLERLRSLLNKYDIDALLVTGAENRRYISGFHGSAGMLFISPSQAILATDFRYTEQAISQAPDFEILRIANSLEDWFPDLCRKGSISRIGFDAIDVSFDLHQRLNQSVARGAPYCRLVPVDGIVEMLRCIKDADEITSVERAVKISDDAFNDVSVTVVPGMTELQVAWELEKHLREHGSESLPFDIIVASGPKAALPHARPSERVIEDGDAVVIDMGARFNGYASDLTRTLCVGTTSDMFKKVYMTVLDAQAAALRIIKSGVTGGDADAAARDVIKQAGHGEDFGHSLGHGVGLAAHELPRLSPGVTEPLADGMIFTVEPGIYISGWGGVRIEDTVVLEHGKLRILSQARKVRYD